MLWEVVDILEKDAEVLWLFLFKGVPKALGRWVLCGLNQVC